MLLPICICLQSALLFAQAPAPTDTARYPQMKNFARLPLAFEHAAGPEDRYIARGQGYLVGIENAKATIAVTTENSRKTVALGFLGGHGGNAAPADELPGKVNDFRGNDPSKWRTGVPTYGRLSYAGVYPGIDVVYYGNQQQLEFDLVVKAGADPGRIRMKVDGASKLSIDGSGALLIDGSGGPRVELPTVYQEIGGVKKSVAGHYTIQGNEVSFALAKYDRSRRLVIDPTITYSTIFGSGQSSTIANAIARDSSGNIIIAGYTFDSTFPVVNAVQSTLTAFSANGNPSNEGFVSKINAAGTALIYSTYLGGSVASANSTALQQVAVDSNGAAWITGNTSTTTFPLLNAAQSTPGGGGQDAVVAKLNSAGALQFSTYLGGNNSDSGSGIAVDSAGNGYVTGSTFSSNFPVTSSIAASGSSKVFVTKYNSSGVVQYSTLLGGNGFDSGNAIAVDANQNAYITGNSGSSTFTGAPAGGAQTTNNGGDDAFIAKLASTGSSLSYFTFLGGTGFDTGQAISVDATGVAYIAGYTQSAGIATAGALQTTPVNGPLGYNGFAAKLNIAGSAFTYVTYLGGTRNNYLRGIAADGNGNAYVAGYTDSINVPLVGAVENAFPANGVSLFNSTNSGITFSTADTNLTGAVAAVSINPSTASEVVITESGTFRSTNAGASFSLQLQASGSVNNGFLARSPVTPGTIYAGFNGGQIYVSTDDGVTWTFQGFTSFTSGLRYILADPLNATTVYAVSNAAPFVYISTDSGVTFTAASTGLPAAQVTALVATTDGALWAGTAGSGVYRSTNQGGSWAAINTGLPAPFYVETTSSLTASGTTVYVTSGQLYSITSAASSWTSTNSFVGYVIAASPQNPLIVYALNFSNVVQVSTDGGVTFTNGATLPSNTFFFFASQLYVDPGNSAHVFLVSAIPYVGLVAKVNSAGSTLTWSTYLGGNEFTEAFGVVTDGLGDAFVTGFTDGSGFPITSTALPQGTFGSFITEISDATPSCTVTVQPASLTTSEFGTLQTFSVVSPSGCTWTASTTQSFATITSGASGTGVGSITLSVAFSTTSSNQTANLQVVSSGNTATVPITQAGNTCAYTLDKSSYPVLPGGGAVTAMLTVSPSGCPWVITNNYPGAISLTTAASGTASASIGFTVRSNPLPTTRSLFLSLGTTEIAITQAGTALSVFTTSLPAADQGTAYSTTLAASGGTPPYGSWAITSGSLPAGLSLNSASGLISGTPTAAGSSTFTVQVTDSAPTTASATLTIIVNPPLSVLAPLIPAGTQGTPYSTPLSATGGTPPYGSWTITAGSLPAGLSLNASSGVIGGTPTGTGSSNFTVRVSDSLGNTASLPLTLTINAPAPAPITDVIPEPEQGEILLFSPSTAGTALLFAAASNQGGFDTEMTLANASSNPLNTPLQSGSCTLSFYGSGAPTPSTNVPGPTILPGAVNTFLLSSYAPGFLGYVIANCGFPLARGSSRAFKGAAFTLPQNAQVLTLPRTLVTPQNFVIPFVTDQVGFDTVISIENTTADPFGTTQSSGTCTLNFYGTGAPANPVTTPTVAAGSFYAFALSSVAPGFQGYIMGSCSFGAAATFNYTKFQNGTISVGFVTPSEPIVLPRGNTNQPLLFPAVSNQLGNDTGIVIANTTSDPFGAQGATPQYVVTRRAAAAPDLCSLYFFGSGAPASQPVLDPLGTLPTGTVHAFTLSSVAPGFAGYVIARCNFPQAKGFSFEEPSAAFTVPGAGYNAFSISPEEVALPRNSASPTTLLFDHVTSTGGADTNVTILNTSSDPFGASGATAQAGSCAITYYGTTGASGPPPVPQTTGSIAAGSELTFSLAHGGSGLTGAPNFNGYLIAQCGFPVARGVAAFFVQPPLSLGGGTLPGANTGQSYSARVSAAGGAPPYMYSATGLPMGITLSATGSFSGMTTQTGSFTVNVQVTDSQSNMTSAMFTLTVSAPAAAPSAPPLTLSGSLPGATASSPYNASFSASGGTPPYSYRATGFPSGISINASTGAVGGQTAQSGTFTVSISVTDYAGVTTGGSYTFSVAAPLPVSLSGANLGSVVLGTPVSAPISASGGTPPYTYTVTSGSLPPGLSLQGGTLSGTPATAGSFSFSVKVTDSTGGTASASFSIAVTPPPLSLNAPSPLATGTVSIGYPTQTVSASGGTSPYTFKVTTGALPAGLTLSSTGMIMGTPTASGAVSFTVTATDSATTPATGTLNLSITIQPFTQNVVLSAGSLSFSLAAGSTALPPAQSVGVQSTMVNQPINYSVAVQPASASWLSAASGTTTPGSVSVSLTQAALALAASTTPYTASVVVTCTSGGCAGSSKSASVSLTVSSPPPQLSVQMTVLAFNTSSATPQATTESLGISNTGGGSIGFSSIACGAPWCTVTGGPGSLGAGASATLTVTADPTGLLAGYYFTSVTIDSSAGKATVPVTLTIAANGVISLGPAGAEFTVPQGGQLGQSNSFLVDITGATPVSYTAAVAPGAPFLQVVSGSGSSSGTSPGTVSYAFDNTQVSQLMAGTYYGSIQVTAGGAANSPQSYEVVLNVTPATTPVVPSPKPGGLVFLTQAGAQPSTQTVTVYSFTPAATAFQVSATTDSGGNWLSVSPTTGSTTSDTPGTLSVTVDPTGSRLRPGVYKGTVDLAFSATAVRSVNVTLVVENSGSATTSSVISRKDAATGGCTPSQLVPTSTGLVSNFAAPAAWPVPLGITLVDDCGDLVTNGQIVATFSNGDPPLILTLADPTMASYVATWTPQHSAGQITINARATAPSFALATAQILGAVTPNNAPILADLAIANFFNPIGGAPLAPGALVQITGQYLASQTMNAPSIPLPMSLGGTSVIIGGMQAPVSMVSPGQVNAQVPFELPAGQPYQVIVNANSALTTPQSFQAGAASPGLGVLPNGFVQAGHGDGSPVTEKAPAKPGETISVYLVGMGATTIPVPSGQPGPSGTFATTVVSPVLTLNGESTTVSFSGLIPGLVGVYQVNFQVPSDAPNGDLTLSLVQNAFASNSGLLPVHN